MNSQLTRAYDKKDLDLENRQKAEVEQLTKENLGREPGEGGISESLTTTSPRPRRTSLTLSGSIHRTTTSTFISTCWPSTSSKMRKR